MTWSLRIFNGDLAKGYDNSLDVVWGSEKVIQDLICWIKEPIGTDPLNPQLGSFVDIGETGQTFIINNKMIDLPSDYQSLVISEIKRLIGEYQTIQQIRINQEVAQFGRVFTFEDDEIISNYNINYIVNYDTLYVTVDLETITGNQYSFNIPVQNDGIIRGI